MQRVGKDEVLSHGTMIAAMILRLGRYLRTGELSISLKTVVRGAYMIPLKSGSPILRAQNAYEGYAVKSCRLD